MYREKALEKMKQVFRDVPYGIEHTLKVLKNAEDIMKDENISEDEKELISIVAILHDIGAIEAQCKYGSMEAVYQEMEGPAVARDILEKIGYDSTRINRVCFIIGNHHTPSKIDGMDFQIQWEADLLENLAYMDVYKDKEELKKYIEDNFRTKAGRNIAYGRFSVEMFL
ncbi:HD domain-containing protein [Anaerosolibacter sp.]|uniref:HD domain-containing protein n=1 Tax=Anaerosolibacter sp. TaxID=1872527 RepID=UPI0039F072BA